MVETLPDFKLVRPQTIKQAIAALALDETARLCAGGTDLIVNMRHGLVETGLLIDISNIEKITSIELNNKHLRIGAGVTLAELTRNETVARTFPAIHQASLAIAGPGHRTRATVGGNLCLDTRCLYYNQSHWWRKSNDYCLKYRGDICHVAPKGNRCRASFSGDLAPALIALAAEIEITSAQGQRTIDLKDFYREDGANHLALAPQEIVTAIFVKTPAGKSAYKKVSIRGAIDFPLAGVAVACNPTTNGTTRFSIAITGTNSAPVIVEAPDLKKDDNHSAFFEALGKLVQRTVSPQRSTTVAAHYRRLSIAAVTVRLAKTLLENG